jgi:hypothetical protein
LPGGAFDERLHERRAEGHERQRVQKRAQVLRGQRFVAPSMRAAERAEHQPGHERGDEPAAAERIPPFSEPSESGRKRRVWAS